ncbi:DUF2304 family protein [Candidatus Woesearchaeota archaeon]|nr:DUF2304 family protein [Candidatus Woesearchaeota archaeon]
MVLGIQLVGTFFGLFMVYYSFLHFKRKEFTAKEFGFWIILWIAFIYISIFPDSLDFIVKRLNLARTLDLFIILGFIILIAIFFYTYTLVRVNQKRMEKIVRDIAGKESNIKK